MKTDVKTVTNYKKIKRNMLTQYTQTRNISANKKLTYCRKEITSRHFAINDWEFACRCQPEFGIGLVSMYELRAHKTKITNCNTASIFCIYILLLHMLLLENKTRTHLTALCPGLHGWASTRKVNQSGFYWSKRQWVAVKSAGPYASLHLAPES